MSEPNEELIEAGWRVSGQRRVNHEPEYLYRHPGRNITLSVPEATALDIERRHRNHAGEGTKASGQPVRERIFAAINQERRRQRELWGDQWEPHATPPMEKFAILAEEVGEVAKGLLEDGEEHPATRKELVEVAAVCVAWLESLREWEEDRG